MPQLRKDPIIGRWVIISLERAKRPHDFASEKTEKDEDHSAEDCIFCEGRERRTPDELLAVRPANSAPNTKGWQVRVITNVPPLLQIEGDMGRRARGIFVVMNGIGAHELIIESPRHLTDFAELDVDAMSEVFKVYAERIKDLEKDKRIKYVLICKNHGFVAGEMENKHLRTQLIAMPVNPKRVKEELVSSRHYYEYRERCIFCDMIRQEIENKERVIVREEGFIAFCPFASRFPFEICVLPEEHSCDFYKINNPRGLARVMKSVMKRLHVALSDPPYNFIIHTAPFRRMASAGFWKTLEYDYHWHIEIMPRLTKVAGFEWGSGFYINPTPPEDAAKFLREVQI